MAKIQKPSKYPSADEPLKSLVFFPSKLYPDMTSHHRCVSPNTGVDHHCPGLFTAPSVSIHTAHRVTQGAVETPCLLPITWRMTSEILSHLPQISMIWPHLTMCLSPCSVWTPRCTFLSPTFQAGPTSGSWCVCPFLCWMFFSQKFTWPFPPSHN